MTEAEARMEARRRFGPRASALSVRRPGKGNRYVVGLVNLSNEPVTLGAGGSFAEAFAAADAAGNTPENVRRAVRKAEGKARRLVFLAALKGLFRRTTA